MGGGGGGGAGTLVFLLFLVLGGGLVAFAVIFHRRGTARFGDAQSWMRSEALIKAARIDKQTQHANNMTTTSYRAVAQYTYRAGGAEREGTRVFLVARPNWNSLREAQAWLAATQPGTTVPLWYDPANPADSALVLNKPSLVMVIVLGGVGAFLLIASLFVLATMMRH